MSHHQFAIFYNLDHQHLYLVSCILYLYVMTPEYGAATQLEKIDMLDYADVIAINKFDKRGALDALRDVKKQFKRNHNLFDEGIQIYH